MPDESIQPCINKDYLLTYLLTTFIWLITLLNIQQTESPGRDVWESAALIREILTLCVLCH